MVSIVWLEGCLKLLMLGSKNSYRVRFLEYRRTWGYGAWMNGRLDGLLSGSKEGRPTDRSASLFVQGNRGFPKRTGGQSNQSGEVYHYAPSALKR